MNVEIDKEALSKIKKCLHIKEGRRKTKNQFNIKKINKSYYVLLIFMIGLASLKIYTSSEKTKLDSVLEDDVTPAFSSNYIADQGIENNLEQFKKQIKGTIIPPILKENISSSEYNDGVIKIKTIGDEKVVNMADGGIVENIYLDYSYGYTVVISYTDDIKVKYYNLNSDVYVTFNQKLNKGDVIGRSVEYSLMDDSYIYLSVFYKNNAIDIRSLAGM